MRALLDINLLIALLDMDHAHHRIATDWLVANISTGWASCPLTENGCIRIMSQSGYPNPLLPAQVAQRLAEATSTEYHRFWPDNLSLVGPDVVEWTSILGARQITDVYLIAYWMLWPTPGARKMVCLNMNPAPLTSRLYGKKPA